MEDSILIIVGSNIWWFLPFIRSDGPSTFNLQLTFLVSLLGTLNFLVETLYHSQLMVSDRGAAMAGCRGMDMWPSPGQLWTAPAPGHSHWLKDGPIRTNEIQLWSLNLLEKRISLFPSGKLDKCKLRGADCHLGEILPNVNANIVKTKPRNDNKSEFWLNHLSPLFNTYLKASFGLSNVHIKKVK